MDIGNDARGSRGLSGLNAEPVYHKPMIVTIVENVMSITVPKTTITVM
jgi:hypothetical protein